MDGWLKGLIAAACVAIVAAVGYYFWQERVRSEELAAYQKEQTMRAGCREVKGDSRYPTLQDYCREHGYID